MPEDEFTLTERVIALSDWCQGMLSGFGLAVRGDDERLTKGDIQETLQDIVNIVHVGGDFDSENDGCVTVRDRDSMEQERVKIDELEAYIAEKIDF